MIIANQRRFARPAFTLVELLVVMAALLVLAAVTLPSVKGLLHDQKVTSAARMVKSHFTTAQARAIASGRQVAVILEPDSNDTNCVSRLSIGNTFPPYSGDLAGAQGQVNDRNGDGFYDQIVMDVSSASLLNAAPALVQGGDFIQIGARQYTFVIESVTPGTTITVNFFNPPYVNGVAAQEPQLPVGSITPQLESFRIYRRPTKSFVQPTILPRGTCIDMTVSGMNQTGVEFQVVNSGVPLMIVFDKDGSVAYWTGSTAAPIYPSGLMHLLVGRKEQVSLNSPLAVADPSDADTFTSNLNDAGNAWLSINPYTDGIYTSQVQTGNEIGTLAQRLFTARQFASNAVAVNEN